MEELQKTLRVSPTINAIMDLLDPEEQIQKRLIAMDKRTQELRNRELKVQKRGDEKYCKEDCDLLLVKKKAKEIKDHVEKNVHRLKTMAK